MLDEEGPDLDDGQPQDGPRDRPFDPSRSPRTAAARAFAGEVVWLVQQKEKHRGERQRKRRPQDHERMVGTVTSLAADLAHRSLVEPGGWLAVTRSRASLHVGGRYGSPVMNTKLPDYLDLLETAGLIEQQMGQRGTGGREGRQTTIRAAGPLRNIMAAHGITSADLERRPEGELVVLKRLRADFWDRGGWEDYAETEETQGYRREVEAINAWLAEADLACSYRNDKGQSVDVQDRRLRRYFNGEIGMGGRLFGGWWMSLPKAERLDAIRIDGQPVVGLDFAQMAPRTLYGREGQQPPAGDAYTIPGLHGRRAGVKKVFNALLFSKGLPKAFPKGSRKAFPRDAKMVEVVEAIADHHRPIAHLFGTGVGFWAMYVESEVMIDVLLALRDRGIVGLPIHDGLIAPARSENEAKGIMLDAFKRHVGVDAEVEVERGG